MGELRRAWPTTAARSSATRSFGFLADAYGRKPVTIVYRSPCRSSSVPVLFLWTHDLTLLLVGAAISGIFVSGQYTWMAAWLPELFPTRVRATGDGLRVQHAAADRLDSAR